MINVKSNQTIPYKKLIVGFDMDGVILDNSRIKIGIAKKLGFALKPHNTPYDAMVEIVPLKILKQIQKTLYNDPRVVSSIPIMKGAIALLTELDKQKINYFLISRRAIPSIAIETLKKNSLWPQYFNKKNSFFIDKPEDKNKIALDLNVTHYIDDDLDIINILHDIPHRFLFDQFGIFKEGPHYTRVKSLLEFKKQLLKKN